MAFSTSSSYTTGMDGTKREEEICLEFPPKVSSPGLPALFGDNDKHGKLMDFSGPRLYIQMVLTFDMTQAIHSLLKYLGLPMFISQILAGIIVGPMVLYEHHSLVAIPENSVAVQDRVAALGYAFFLVLSGVKMDVRFTYKSGRKAVFIGFLTVVVPLIFSLITVRVLHPEGNLFTNKSFFLAVTYSGTSFPVIHYLLSELKILNSEVDRLIPSVAFIGDIVALVLINFSQWVQAGLGKGRDEVLIDVGLPILFVLVGVFVLRPGMKWMERCTPEAGRIKDIRFYAANDVTKDY